MHTNVIVSGPYVRPLRILWQKHKHVVDERLYLGMDWGHKQLRTHHELVVQPLPVYNRVVWKHEHHVSDDGPAKLVSFLHQLLAVEAPALEDDGHFEEMSESLCVVVELPVV